MLRLRVGSMFFLGLILLAPQGALSVPRLGGGVPLRQPESIIPGSIIEECIERPVALEACIRNTLVPSPTEANEPLGQEDLPCQSLTMVDRCESWVSSYNEGEDSSNGEYSISGIAVNPTSSFVYAAGHVWQEDGFDLLTSAYRPNTGERVWTSRFDGPKKLDDRAADVLASPDGSIVYVVASVDRIAAASSTACVIAYDARSGAVRWVRRYELGPDAGDATLQAGALSSDGGTIYVAGRVGPEAPPGSHSDGADTKFLVLSIEATSGDLQWFAPYDSGSASDQATDLVVSEEKERVVVSGVGGESNDNPDLVAVAFDTAGRRQGRVAWAARYDHDGEDAALGIALSADEASVHLTGTSQRSRGSDWYDFLTLALAVDTGERVWTSRLLGGSPGFNGGFGITDGSSVPSTYVTGIATAEDPQDLDMLTAAYDPRNGVLLWRAYCCLPGNSLEGGVGLTLSRDRQSVLVTGFSGPYYVQETTLDLVAAELDVRSGSAVWRSRFNASPTGATMTMVSSIAPALSSHGAFMAADIRGVPKVLGVGPSLQASEDSSLLISYSD